MKNKMIIKNVIVVVLCSVIFISCATKLARYEVSINTTYKPSTLLSITESIISDEKLNADEKSKLLYKVLDRALELVKKYPKYSDDKDVKSYQDEIVAVAQSMRLMVKYFDSQGVRLDGALLQKLLQILR